jgi:hypothetical protein
VEPSQTPALASCAGLTTFLTIHQTRDEALAGARSHD